MTSGDPVDVVVLGTSHLDSAASNIANGFEDVGLRVRVVDPFARLAGRGTTRVHGTFGAIVRRIVDQWDGARATLIDKPTAAVLRELDPRLVLSVYGYFSPGQIDEWRRCAPRATWALWYPDSFVNLGSHRVVLASYDHFFFKDPYIVDRFANRAGLPAQYLPQACNPRHHRPTVDGGRDDDAVCDVVVVGNLYPYRLLTLDKLSPDVRLRIYGNQRSPLPERFSRLAAAHVGRPVFGLDKAKVFAQARIVLSTMHYGEVQGVNARLFEATGSGGFVLTHSNDAISRYFDLGREVAVFETPDELNSAIAHYLARPDERAAIAGAGAARTHREHTYPIRVLELIRMCGLQDQPRFDVARQRQ